jgi:hypothetical protein
LLLNLFDWIGLRWRLGITSSRQTGLVRQYVRRADSFFRVLTHRKEFFPEH